MAKQTKIFIIFCFIFVVIISIRYFFIINAPDNLKNIRDTEEAHEIIGKIIGQSDIRPDHIQYILKDEIYKEKILISLPLYPEFFYHDRIKITGKFLTPAEFEDFNYKNYLLKDGIRSVSYYPEVELIKRAPWNLYQPILEIKSKLRKTSQKIFQSPQSEILNAMILGEKGLLPQDVKNDFSRAGLSHVLAISGMHIGILVSILIFLLGKTRLRDKSFYLISGFLIFYVILIGAPPSALRASVMAGILLLASKVHRQYVAKRALLIAGLVMLAFNPLLLIYDVGFQLSFLAVYGILELGAPLQNFLEKILEGHLNWLSIILTITLSAQIFTLPIIIYNFGIFSLISPIANIVVVPLLPFVISLGFLTLIIGSLSTSIGIFLAFPLHLILSFIIRLAELSASLKFGVIEIQNTNFAWVLFLYLLIFAITWKIKSKN